jgi:hypothetical protein
MSRSASECSPAPDPLNDPLLDPLPLRLAGGGVRVGGGDAALSRTLFALLV